MIETQINDWHVKTIVLERVAEDEEDHLTSTRELIAAIDELARGWLEPLGIGFGVGCCEPEFMDHASAIEPPQKFWFLRVAELPRDARIRIPFVDSREVLEVRLEASKIARRVLQAMEQPCGDKHLTALGILWWTMTRVRLPIDEPLEFLDGRYRYDAPIDALDGARWVYGPAHTRIEAPVEVFAYYESTVTEIKLHINWHIWVDYPALVDEGVARVLARPGWRRTF